MATVEELTTLIDRIRAALGTEETGDALVEVAAASHAAELASASEYDEAYQAGYADGQSDVGE